jgi:hypothetical protein
LLHVGETKRSPSTGVAYRLHWELLYCAAHLQTQVPQWRGLQSLRLDLAQPGAASVELTLDQLLQAMQPGQCRLHTLAVRGHTSLSDK